MNSSSSDQKREGLIPEITPPAALKAPRRTETKNHYIYEEPRISAPKLAEYAVAGHARQKTIAQNAKVAPKVIIGRYRETRDLFSSVRIRDGINTDSLLRGAKELDERIPESPWQKDNNPRNATALRQLVRIADQIECQGGEIIHRPAGGWGGIKIQGVYVSVDPELIFSIVHRGIRKVGAVILNIGQNAALDRNHDGHSVGDFLATLLYHMLETRLPSTAIPLHTRCYAIDVAREKIYKAPLSHKRLLKNLGAACEMIAMRWPSIDVDAIIEPEGVEEV